MRRGALVAGGVGVALAVALVVATHVLARPKVEGRLEGDPVAAIRIAPRDAAITLARVAGDAPRVVLVVAADPDGLDAIDLEAALGRPLSDTVEAFAVAGLDGLADAARGAATFRVRYEELGLPFDAGGRHVAAGTNFRSHAEEVGRDEGPFLFPKLSRPTAWRADVPGRARLDYEAEICAVTLSPHRAAAPADLGFVLCNDFTDRLTLVREMDLGGPMGVTGFADAKGGDGMLPIGPLLVVPRDADAFHRDVVLELYVDGVLRQRARGGLMVWPPAEVLARALTACDAVHHTTAGPIALTDCETIPARTLVLTGTPGGVLFHPLTLWSPGAYLQPGDEVVTVGTHLGVLRNRVR